LNHAALHDQHFEKVYPMNPPNVTRPVADPASLLSDAGHELRWTLRAAAEWKLQHSLNLQSVGYEVQVFAMDSTFLHARALFEFLTGRDNSRNYHSIVELDPSGQLQALQSAIYASDWSGPLHDRIAHLQDRTSDPMVASRSGGSEHLKNMPAEFADEIRNLWAQLIAALRATGLGALASQADQLLRDAENAALLVSTSERSDLYS